MIDLDAFIDTLADRIAARLRDNESRNSARLLSVEDAAKYIGRTKSALDHLISAGKIPVVRRDRRVMIDVRDLDRWIEDGKR